MCEAGTESPQRDSSYRLRVSHFLLTMTLCAIASSVQIAWTQWEGTPIEIHTYVRISILYSSLLYGVALSCLLLFWWNGQAWERQPGQYLLVFFATTALLNGVSSLITWRYTSHSNSTNPEFYAWNLEKILLCSTIGTNCLVFAWLLHGNRWWKVLLFLPGCVLLLLVPQHCLAMSGYWKSWFVTAHPYAQIFVTILVIPLVALACRHDRRTQEDRDWLHWTGVGLTCLFAIGGCIEAIAWLAYYG